ncbi:orotidine-5'-phosphate decarboxylase [Thalassobaculum litoreum]|uniref:Orotidine 5'-phosphate decarboxylase n=1 Tax=Thalassobaculum litoreum DSM 18839 TaxID=1123362 RepID=A0A8G2BGN4_9PROT|nr:orotidine-5'-phosphate decarboxylase [Thalassobaculum litoreum]SDF28445.1 orotidine-5'-phosphate decarboxylase [Thalassobaculum litoreum DSM 18839]
MQPHERILVAIDTPDMATARALAARVRAHVGGIKLGMEFHNANGPEGVREIAGDTPLFLDLKYHDIPNTVAGAIRSAVTTCRPRIINIHASGGPAMMRAAVAANKEAAEKIGIEPPLMIAVTVLTSIDDSDLDAVGQATPSGDQVKRLALLAKAAGCDGVVCSPHEIAALHAACGEDFTLVVPGIRPADAAEDDQKRKMTPADAVAAGADYIVIGRPITQAADPAAAAKAIAESLL